MDPGNSDHNSYCTCRACDFSAALSRRQLLKTGAASAIAYTVTCITTSIAAGLILREIRGDIAEAHGARRQSQRELAGHY